MKMISSLRSGLLRWHASSSVAFLGQGYRLLSWLMLSQNYSLSLSSCRARMSCAWMCAFIFLSCLFGVKPSQTDLALVSRVKNKGDTNERNDCRHGKRPSFFKRRGRRGDEHHHHYRCSSARCSCGACLRSKVNPICSLFLHA